MKLEALALLAVFILALAPWSHPMAAEAATGDYGGPGLSAGRAT
jgi:hypothetical protein